MHVSIFLSCRVREFASETKIFASKRVSESTRFAVHDVSFEQLLSFVEFYISRFHVSLNGDVRLYYIVYT